MRNDGGKAFPSKGGMCFYFPETMKEQVAEVASQIEQSTEGMSLRDWFAGQALVGLIAQTPTATSAETFACEAYAMADAMLAEREKSDDQG